MAYSITALINEYNAADAVMLQNSIIKNHGILAYANYYLANKQLAHTYNLYDTLPTAGVRTLADGVANSTITGSNTTTNLTLFAANGAWDKAFVGTDLDKHWNRQAPLYFNAVADIALKSIVYGTNATFGNTLYTGTGLHQYVTAKSTTTCLQTTGSATGCTSIFAVRFSPFEDIDGAAIVVDPVTNEAGNMLYVNQNWINPITIAGSTGPFEGHQMFFNMDGVMILPGANNAAAITGIKSGSLPTEQQVDEMLDKVRPDSYTYIFCNLAGKGILSRLGKSGALQMGPNDMGYTNQILQWNGVPIVVTDTITSTETGLLYSLT